MADRIEAGLGDRAPANDTGESEMAPAASGTHEPEPPAPTSRPLNRHERRRMRALGRAAAIGQG
jgi:hypothetical protein